MCQGRDAVWIASYPRSGNTWVRFLLAGYAYAGEVNWDSASFTVPDIHPWLAKDGGPRMLWDKALHVSKVAPASAYRSRDVLLKTHYVWSPLHPCSERSAGAVLVVRSPRDVLLSSWNYHRLMGSQHAADVLQYARDFIEHRGDPRYCREGYGTWEEHTRSWLSAPFPVLIVLYERMLQDPRRELLRMAGFLGIRLDPARAAEAMRTGELDEMRRLEASAREEGRFVPSREGRNFFNSGRSGQSLDELEPGLDAAFEEAFAPALAELMPRLEARAGAAPPAAPVAA